MNAFLLHSEASKQEGGYQQMTFVIFVIKRLNFKKTQ